MFANPVLGPAQQVSPGEKTVIPVANGLDRSQYALGFSNPIQFQSTPGDIA